MPPARTGVADYSASMAAGLRRAGHQVNLNSPGDVDLYHVGNNPLHRPIYERALARPGVVLIHDAVLHHFHLGFDDEARYIEEFVYNYGEWHRGVAGQLWRGRARSASEPAYFAYPMLRRICENARLVIVHNPAAADLVRRHAPAARIEELPHLIDPPPAADPHAVVGLRAEWAIPAGGAVFGIFGHLRESKRLHSALAALDRVPQAHLLVAGEFVSSDFARTMEPLLAAHGRVIRVGYLAESDFWQHAHAVDACVNLRYPAAGETSGIAIRLMSAGKPVLLSAGREAAAIPAGACLQVDTGVGEEEMLSAYMHWLAGSPAAARQIGEAARRHVRSKHAADRVVSRLVSLLAAAQG